MSCGYDIAFIGLSLSSSWGNGHATTYRALIRGLAQEGARVLFLERDVPWYRDNRDLPDPDFCDLGFYGSLDELERWSGELDRAGMVVVGSYVPQGAAIVDRLLARRPRFLGYYDIDTPVTLAALAKGDTEYLRAGQIADFDACFSFTGGPTLQRLERTFGARRAVALHCSVDPERYHPQNVPIRWDLGYLGTYSEDRQPGLERFLLSPARAMPDRRFVVAGPQYPASIEWPSNVERIEHLEPSRHREFYCSQRYTLNLTRADMVRAGWSPSVRLFEAAACGTPIISDRWPGLADLFPEGRAILIADGADDVLAALSNSRDDDRKAMARTARRIVLDGHTGRSRAREMLAAGGLAGELPASALQTATG